MVEARLWYRIDHERIAGWDRRIPAFELPLPGDVSAASALVVAAQIVQGSRVTLRGIGTNPTRSGLLEIARDMGGGLAVEPQGEHGGEPLAAIHAWSAPLRAVAVGGETTARGIDDLPAACALAARASGTTRIVNAEEWSDGMAAMATVLRAFGVACEEGPGALSIDGREGPLEGAEVDTAGDARIAMAAAVLALAGRSPTRVRDAACIADLFPKFVATLRALGFLIVFHVAIASSGVTGLGDLIILPPHLRLGATTFPPSGHHSARARQLLWRPGYLMAL